MNIETDLYNVINIFVVMNELPAMFALTKFPKHGTLHDSYSVCGRCQRINRLYPLSNWTCSKPATITNNIVTVTMDIYEHCDFKWKWRNLAFDSNGGRAYEFGSDERTFYIGAGCGEGMITQVETEWEVYRDKVTGDCVSDVPAQTVNTEPTLPSTFPIEPTPQSSSPVSLFSMGPGLGSHITTDDDLSRATEEHVMTSADTSIAGESVIIVTKSTQTQPVTQSSSKTSESALNFSPYTKLTHTIATPSSSGQTTHGIGYTLSRTTYLSQGSSSKESNVSATSSQHSRIVTTGGPTFQSLSGGYCSASCF